MSHNSSKAPRMFTLIWKGAVLVLLGLLLVNFLLYTVQFVSGVDGDPTKAELINWCERDYRSRDYSGLYEHLNLYHLYDSDFDLYWEAVNGYNTLISYDQWRRAAGMGIAGAEEQAQRCYDTLRTQAGAPKHSENARILRDFLQQADSIP